MDETTDLTPTQMARRNAKLQEEVHQGKERNGQLLDRIAHLSAKIDTVLPTMLVDEDGYHYGD